MKLNSETIISECGFDKPVIMANRFFYNKNGFKLIEHQGEYKLAISGKFYGRGKPIKTTEELNNLYNNWVQRKI